MTDDIERRKLADGSHELLTNAAFNAAILALRKQWFSEWVASNDEVKDRILKAQIRALEDMPQQLQLFINDQTMAQARKK